MVAVADTIDGTIEELKAGPVIAAETDAAKLDEEEEAPHSVTVTVTVAAVAAAGQPSGFAPTVGLEQTVSSMLNRWLCASIT